MTKFMTGGWIVIVIAAAVTILMTTWIAGRRLLQKSVLSESVRFEDFMPSIGAKDIIRTPKTAVFLSGTAAFVPRALLHNFKHNGTIHAVNLIVCVQNEEVPYVNSADACSLTDFGNGMYRIILRYGFMESPDIPRDIAAVPLPVQRDTAQFSYFLGKESLVLTKRGKMAFWRKQLFLIMTKNSLNASAFFNLPPNRVVELGVQIEF
jgi:KUP system potassium uptake protein